MNKILCWSRDDDDLVGSLCDTTRSNDKNPALMNAEKSRQKSRAKATVEEVPAAGQIYKHQGRRSRSCPRPYLAIGLFSVEQRIQGVGHARIAKKKETNLGVVGVVWNDIHNASRKQGKKKLPPVFVNIIQKAIRGKEKDEMDL